MVAICFPSKLVQFQHQSMWHEPIQIWCKSHYFVSNRIGGVFDSPPGMWHWQSPILRHRERLVLQFKVIGFSLDIPFDATKVGKAEESIWDYWLIHLHVIFSKAIDIIVKINNLKYFFQHLLLLVDPNERSK